MDFGICIFNLYNLIEIKIFDLMGMMGKIRGQMWLVLLLMGLALISFILMDMM